MITDNYYIGTDLKFAINITAEGFDMDTDDYEIILRCGGKRITVPKSEIVVGENNTHYLLVNTDEFTGGTLRMVVKAQVPDDDFDDGYRAEVAAIDLCVIKKAL